MGRLPGRGCWHRHADRVSLLVLVSVSAARAGCEGDAAPAVPEVPQMARLHRAWPLASARRPGVAPCAGERERSGAGPTGDAGPGSRRCFPGRGASGLPARPTILPQKSSAPSPHRPRRRSHISECVSPRSLDQIEIPRGCTPPVSRPNRNPARCRPPVSRPDPNPARVHPPVSRPDPNLGTQPRPIRDTRGSSTSSTPPSLQMAGCRRGAAG